jgi:hypothetical protein
MSDARHATLVVVGWTIGNAVLAAILVGFREHAIGVSLFLSSLALPGLFAALLWRAEARASTYDSFALSGGSRWVLPAALGVTLVVLGFLFGYWLMVVGGVLVVPSLVQLLRPGARPAHPPPDLAVDSLAVLHGPPPSGGRDDRRVAH